MAWTINYAKKTEKDFKKIGHVEKRRIITYIEERVAVDPYRFGEELSGDLTGLWKYRVGDYRLICDIQEEIVTILVVKVGHRKEVYLR